MINLQLLLSQPSVEPELDPGMRERLEALGMQVTGSGYATVSAQIAPEHYARLFGAPPPLHGGSVATPQAAPVLPVPAELADSVKLVTIAAKPATMG